jgi:subtilase family serine protease
MEMLESRSMLSATVEPLAQPLSGIGTSSGLTVSQIETAYALTGVTGSNGTAAGAGQTIAIIDAYNDPDIKSDLATFDSSMGLPVANLTVVNQSGGTSLPASNASWSLEISLDVEWAHAIAPGANILLVEASSSNLNDLLAAVNYARNVSSVSVVSMSWGTSEFMGETQDDSYFTTPAGHIGISFVASSGDSGSPGLWPAMSTNVLAVGGTTLTTTSNGTYVSETAWSDSGGGTSVFEPEPSYQSGVQSTGMRTSPDVSYNANPSTGYAVYDSVAYGGTSGWSEVGGTSAGAPQWAGLIAIADQGRVAASQSTLNGAQAALYSLSSSDFHDITSGSNGGYSATTGYDEVTGRGTPVGNLIISGLEAYTASSSSSSGSSGSGSSGSGSSGSGSSGSGGTGGFGGFGGGYTPPGHHFENYYYYGSSYFSSYGFGFDFLADTAPDQATSAPGSSTASVSLAQVSSPSMSDPQALSGAFVQSTSAVQTLVANASVATAAVAGQMQAATTQRPDFGVAAFDFQAAVCNPTELSSAMLEAIWSTDSFAAEPESNY